VDYRSLPTRILPLLVAAAMMAGCVPQEEQAARQAIDQVDAAVTAAGTDATKYIPRQVTTVTTAVSQLKIQFYDKDYKGVLAAAPPVLEKARNLPTLAAAKKAEIAESLEKVWTELSTGAPAALEAVDRHVDELLESGKLPTGVNLEIVQSAKVGVGELKDLWNKATAAKAAGNIEEAVTLGTHAQRRAENLLAALGGSSQG
jgi:hypothetical protein